MNNTVDTIKQQIESLKEELKNPTINQNRHIEVTKLINQNKTLLETVYKDLNKSNGKTFRELEKELQAMPNAIIRATGINLLDNFFGGGIEEETFINLVGESGSGKSTLAIEILLNIAEFNKSVFFSFEMGIKRTHKKISKFELTENQKDNLIIDLDTYNIEELKREISLYANNGVKFFCIDSKMKLQADGFKEEYKKISYISNELSRLTQNLGIIIVLINQISEENLKNGRVSLKGSGDQIYDSDIVLVYKKVKDNTDIRHLEIFKNRTGDEKVGVIETKLEYGKTVSTNEVKISNFGDNDFFEEML